MSGLNVLMDKFFYPSVRLVNQLKSKQKFRLIALLGLIPIVILMFFLLREINSGIAFTKKETYGLEYIQKLYNLSLEINNHAELDYEALNGNSDFKVKAAESSAKIESILKEIDVIDNKYKNEINATANLEEVKNNWKNNQLNESPNQSLTAHIDFMADVNNLMRTVADNSNLTLDTKVDSHYLIVTLIDNIPVINSYLLQAKILGTSKLTTSTKAKLGLYAVLIQSSLEGVNSNLGRVFKNNNDLKSKLGPIQNEVDAVVPDSVKAIQNRLLTETGIELDLSDYAPSIQASLNSINKLNDAVAPLLDKLLKNRIDGLETRRFSIVSIVILILILVIYLFIAIYISVIEISEALARRDKELAEINKNLEKVVEERTLQLKDEIRNISSLLNGMQQAVFAVGVDGKVVPPVSLFAQTVFGGPIEGFSIFDTIYKDADPDGEIMVSLKTAMSTVFGEGDLQWSLMEDCFPKQLEYRRPNEPDAESRILKVTIQPLWDEDECLQKLLFIVEDITEVLSLERYVAAEKAASARNIQMIQELANLEMDELKSYFSTSYKFIEECSELVAGMKNPSDEMIIVLRHLHTLKGNARVYGFPAISSLVHRVESDVGTIRDQLRDNQLNLEDAKDLFESAFSEVQSLLNEYGRLMKKIFRTEDESELKTVASLHRQIMSVDLLLGSTLSYTDEILEHNPQAAEVTKAIEVLKSGSKKEVITSLGSAMDSLERTVVILGEQSQAHELKDLNKATQATIENSPTSDKLLSNVVIPWHKLRNQLKRPYVDSSLFVPHNMNAENWVPVFSALLALTIRFKDHRNSEVVVDRVKMSKALDDFWSSCFTQKFEYLAEIGKMLDEAISISKDLKHAEALLQQAWNYLSLVSQASLLDFPQVKLKLRETLLTLPKDANDSAEVLRLLKKSDSIILLVLQKISKEGMNPIIFFEEASKALGLAKTEDAIRQFIGEGSGLLDLSTLCKYFKEDKADSDLSSDIIQENAKNGDFFCKSLIQFVRPAETAFSGLGYIKSIDLLQLLIGCSNDPEFAQYHQQMKTIEIIDANFNRVRQILTELPKNEIDPESLIRSYDSLLNLPVKPSLYRLLPMINEVSKRLGKKIQYRVLGENITMNPDQLHLLMDAMGHIVRNSIDHGLENPDVRLEAKKPESGTIEIECSTEADHLRIDVRDDGNGIDIDKVIEKAIAAKGFTRDQITKMSPEQKLNLVFLPGLSTKQEVSELSGRGVGMDIVKTNIEKIGGSIEISSQLGKGTEFIIKLAH